MALKDKLPEIRKKFNLSQEQFAEMLRVSRQSVSKWERGQGYPEIDKLIFISEEFNISLDELIKETNSSRKKVSLRKKSYLPLEEINNELEDKKLSIKIQTENKYVNYIDNLKLYNLNESTDIKNDIFVLKKLKNNKRKLFLSFLLFLMIFIPIFSLGVSISKTNTLYNNDINYAENLEYNYYNYENINFFYDEINERYYVIENQNGIIDSIYSEELDNYIKLKNVLTGEVCFIYIDYDISYDCENVFYTDDKNITKQFNIPRYLMPSYINSSEIENYFIMQNKDKNKKFIPKEIIEKFINIEKTDLSVE
jgi:transcriptional regulator with XRE-family HTH domain